MPKFDVTLDDGRTIRVQADTRNELFNKVELLNKNVREGEQWAAKYKAPEPVSTGQAMLLGAGREADKMLSGAQDLYYGATGNTQAQSDLARQQAVKDEAFQNVQQQAPIASAAGGILPYLGIPTAGLLPTVGTAAALGGARYGDDRVESALSDAALSALPFGAGRAYRGIADQLTDPGTATSMVERAQDMGWPLSPGDILGSDSLKRLEARIQSTSMPFNPMSRMMNERQRMVNRAAAEAIGESGDVVNDEVLGAAASRLADEFESLEILDEIPVGDEFVGRLADVAATSQQRLFKDNQIAQTVDRVLDYVTETGTLRPEDYQSLTSQLKAKIRQSFRGESPDPDFADSLGQIVEALDDVAEQGMTGEALQRLIEARRQWKALKAVERGARESGDVSGPLMANYLRRSDKGGYLRGRDRSELYETARMSKAFPAKPDSGTASRSQNWLEVAASPFVSAGSNLYFYGMQAPSKAGRLVSENIPSAMPAPLIGRGVAGGYTPEPEQGETVRPRPETDAEPGRLSDTGNTVRAILKQAGGMNDDSATQIANRLMDPAISVEEVEAMVQSGRIPRSLRAALSEADLPPAVKEALTRFNPR